jgi:Flp pilus assembly protein TadG
VTRHRHDHANAHDRADGHGRAHQRRPDDGQATVELALCLPVVVLLVLGVVQVAVVVRDQLAVELAAREGARAAAVSAAPADAGASAAARAAPSLSLDTTTVVGAGTVTVTVSAPSHTDVPLIGALVADVRVSATVTMALEPP